MARAFLQCSRVLGWQGVWHSSHTRKNIQEFDFSGLRMKRWLATRGICACLFCQPSHVLPPACAYPMRFRLECCTIIVIFMNMCTCFQHISAVSFRNGSMIYDHRFCEEGQLYRGSLTSVWTDESHGDLSGRSYNILYYYGLCVGNILPSGGPCNSYFARHGFLDTSRPTLEVLSRCLVARDFTTGPVPM